MMLTVKIRWCIRFFILKYSEKFIFNILFINLHHHQQQHLHQSYWKIQTIKNSPSLTHTQQQQQSNKFSFTLPTILAWLDLGWENLLIWIIDFVEQSLSKIIFCFFRNTFSRDDFTLKKNEKIKSITWSLRSINNMSETMSWVLNL
jgi:hypothetical protein